MIQKTLWYESWERLKENKTALICGAFILLNLFVAGFAEWLAPYPFDEQNTDLLFAPPSFEHWLGTDDSGRDVFSRLIYGTRISLVLGILSSFLSLILGVLYGSLSGWLGGRTDAVMMRILDILYSIPILILIILVKLIFESIVDVKDPELRAFIGLLVALSIAGWMNLGRVVRGQVLQLKTTLYVESARALGAGHFEILSKHIFPNMMGPIIVLLTMQMPINILSESFISFLGLGLQPPYSSWGILANEGWRTLSLYPHLMIAPGVALFLACLAFNLLGDGLRDALDPSSHQ
ncbi:MAG: ABC transporter permease [Bdellovibrionales bacterium]|nr:ABC transporter permease [Bdellovibrionales bacterium]